jgi:site-specific recombinase XerD
MSYVLYKDKVGDFLAFLEQEKNVSLNTVRAYRADLAQFLSFWQRVEDGGPVVAATPSYVMQRYLVSLFYDKMLKATLSRKLSCLRSFSAFLKQQGIVLEVKVKNPRQEKRLPSILSIDEISYLLDQVKIEELPSRYPYRDRAIMEMLYATGVRCSELTHMKVSDIDMNEKTIRIMGKGRKERMVLFGEKAKTALISYFEYERSAFGFEKDCFVFVGPSGKRIAERTVQRICEMYRHLLKIERPLTPHKIRHSFATHLLNQGVDLRVIQELLGHTSLSTVEIYTHVSSAELARMCDAKHPLNTMEFAQTE